MSSGVVPIALQGVSVMCVTIVFTVASQLIQIFMPPTSYVVDKYSCSCDCFDRKMKGPYFDPQYQYKSVYFNFDWETSFLFGWTLLFAYMAVCLFYKAFVSLLSGTLSPLKLAFFILPSVQMYYGWGTIFNYVNDAFYTLIPTQLFFVMTEGIGAGWIAFWLLREKRPLKKWEKQWLHVSNTVALAHLWLSLGDQGLQHVFEMLGLSKANVAETLSGLFLRDAMFILGDISILIASLIALYESKCQAQSNHEWGSLLKKTDEEYVFETKHPVARLVCRRGLEGTYLLLIGFWCLLYYGIKTIYGYQ